MYVAVMMHEYNTRPQVGVEYDTRKGVHVDACFQTANPSIYATGDCASPFKFTHAADWQVWRVIGVELR